MGFEDSDASEREMSSDLTEKAQLKSQLCDIFNLDGGAFDEETGLFSSGLLNSFDLVELVTFIEEKSGKRVRTIDVNLDNFDSLARIVAYLNRRTA
jgi:acyl carrier protein